MFLYKLSLLKKGHGPSFVQSRIPFIQGCVVPLSLVETGPVVLEKKMDMWKHSYFQTGYGMLLLICTLFKYTSNHH